MIRPALLACCLTVATIAQESPASNRFVPADALFTMRVAAPATWRTTFAGTRLGKVFAAPTLAPIVGRMQEGFEQLLEKGDAAGMPRDVMQALLHDYKGELIVSACFDFSETLASEEDIDPKQCTMLVLTPDGTPVLEKLLAGFRAVDAKGDTPLEELQLGEHRFRATKRPSRITQAELIEGHLVMFVGDEIETFAPKMLATTNRAETTSKAPFSARFDLGGLMKAVTTSLEESEVLDGAEGSASKAMQAMGLSSLRSLDVTLDAAGEHMTGDITLRTTGTDLGLLGLLLVDQKKPTSIAALPANCDSFQVGAFDPNAIVRTLRAILAQVDIEGASWDQIEAAFEESMNVRLREDVLDHLGTEMMALGDMRSLCEVALETLGDGDRPDPNTVFSGYCIGLSLRNGKALGQSIDTMLRKAGLHAARKTEDYRDQKISTLRVGGVLSIEYAITDTMLFLVVGTKGAGNEYLRAALDAQAAGGEAQGLPANVQKQVAELPEGWSGVATYPVVELMRALLEVGAAGAEARGVPLQQEGLDIVRGLAKDLVDAGLGEMLSVTYTSASAWRTVYRW